MRSNPPKGEFSCFVFVFIFAFSFWWLDFHLGLQSVVWAARTLIVSSPCLWPEGNIERGLGKLECEQEILEKGSPKSLYVFMHATA